MIITFLAISVSFNILMIWYATKLLGTMRFIQENAEAIQVISEDFKQHLDAVNQMEMYFGDETLSELLKHAEHVSGQISALSEIMEIQEEDEDEGSTEDANKEEE
tara:strand:+ start:189 stop:503 length:315 start_codon:yes stop_codon:yes gene_type:complete